MEPYKDIDGDSGVAAYEIGDTFIKVRFKSNSKVYVYTYQRPGQQHVETMKQLAVRGDGLQAYINTHRNAGYTSTEY